MALYGIQLAGATPISPGSAVNLNQRATDGSTLPTTADITAVTTNWKTTLDKCKDTPPMRSPDFWVNWEDVAFKNTSATIVIDLLMAEAVVAVTAISNVPVSYAFGNGKGGTTCDDVSLVFPAPLSVTASIPKSNQQKISNIMEEISGPHQWPAYIIEALGNWVQTANQPTPTRDKVQCNPESSVECNPISLQNFTDVTEAGYAAAAIHALTGSPAQFTYDKASMDTVLAQAGTIQYLLSQGQTRY